MADGWTRAGWFGRRVTWVWFAMALMCAGAPGQVAAKLRVSVTDSDTGQPVPGAKVSVQLPSGQKSQETDTGPDGSWEYSLNQTGHHLVTVRCTGYDTGIQGADVRQFGDDVAVPISLRKRGTKPSDLVDWKIVALVRGKDAEGAVGPLAGATVRLNTGKGATTGPDGWATLDIKAVFGDEYQITAEAQGFVTAMQPITIAQGSFNPMKRINAVDQVQFLLQAVPRKAVQVLVTVYDAKTSQAIPRATVCLGFPRATDGSVYQARKPTDDKGQAAFLDSYGDSVPLDRIERGGGLFAEGRHDKYQSRRSDITVDLKPGKEPIPWGVYLEPKDTGQELEDALKRAQGILDDGNRKLEGLRLLHSSSSFLSGAEMKCNGVAEKLGITDQDEQIIAEAATALRSAREMARRHGETLAAIGALAPKAAGMEDEAKALAQRKDFPDEARQRAGELRAEISFVEVRLVELVAELEAIPKQSARLRLLRDKLAALSATGDMATIVGEARTLLAKASDAEKRALSFVNMPSQLIASLAEVRPKVEAVLRPHAEEPRAAALLAEASRIDGEATAIGDKKPDWSEDRQLRINSRIDDLSRLVGQGALDFVSKLYEAIGELDALKGSDSKGGSSETIKNSLARARAWLDKMGQAPKAIVMPDLRGKTEGEALAVLSMLELGGVGIDQSTSRTPSKEDAGRVQRQEPAAGTRLTPGMDVTLIVYRPFDPDRDSKESMEPADPGEMIVPSVVTLRADEARSILKERGFGSVTFQPATDPPPSGEIAHHVQRQDPPGGASVPKGTPVTLTIYGECKTSQAPAPVPGGAPAYGFPMLPPGLLGGDEGTMGAHMPPTTGGGSITVPDLRGKTDAEATDVLFKLGFGGVGSVLSDTRTPSNGDAGKVQRQDPSPGKVVPQGASATLVIYRPFDPENQAATPAPMPGQLGVPSVLTLKPAEARSILKERGFSSVTFIPASDPPPSADLAFCVQRQDPAGGASVPPGTPVQLTCYGEFPTSPSQPMTTPGTVPAIVGLAAKAADAKLAGEKLRGSLQGAEGTDDPARDKTVAKQDPAAGASAPADGVVRYWIYAHTPKSTVMAQDDTKMPKAMVGEDPGTPLFNTPPPPGDRDVLRGGWEGTQTYVFEKNPNRQGFSGPFNISLTRRKDGTVLPILWKIGEYRSGDIRANTKINGLRTTREIREGADFRYIESFQLVGDEMVGHRVEEFRGEVYRRVEYRLKRSQPIDQSPYQLKMFKENLEALDRAHEND